jgi:hypothetical protein
MSLTQIVEKEKTSSKLPEDRINSAIKDERPRIYSPKLDEYVLLDSSNPKGEIQKYNVGMGPGSWY